MLAHGPAPTPETLWSTWAPDSVAVAGLAAVATLYVVGRSRRVRTGFSVHRRCAQRRRDAAFAAGLGLAAVALVSPLDALSGALAAAHMVQHLILVAIAAPLLASAAPMVTLLRSLPGPARLQVGRWRRSGPARWWRPVSANPLPAGAVHAATLWFWHARVPYVAALEHELVHRVEHALFVITAVWFWRAVLRTGRRGGRLGMSVLALFLVALQGSVLGALLTFSTTSWYPPYAATAPLWGLTALTDQQLAGVLMWAPGGLGYLVVALSLVARSLGDGEAAPSETSGGEASGPVPVV